jgi:hypothetical protein
MNARRVTVSVECCDFDTGEMALVVEDPDSPEANAHYQQMILHPAVCDLLHTLLGRYVTDGVNSQQSLNLNSPGGAS